MNIFEAAASILSEGPQQAALLKAINDNIKRLTPAAKSLGANLPQELKKVTFDKDDDGFMHAITANLYIYLLSKAQIKKGGFGEESNEEIVLADGGNAFVLVAV